LKQYLLEESYEVLESIDKKDWEMLSAELGDLLLQIVFHCEIASRKGNFDFNKIVDMISKKLIDRHPHVFGNKEIHTANEVQDNWEHSKVVNENRNSILSGIPKIAPALLQAQRLQAKAATVGFDWDNINPVIEKIDEEWNEFKEAMKQNNRKEMEQELGDIFFSFVNLGRLCNIIAEDALRLTNNKFKKRFNYIEQQYNNDPKLMKSQSLQSLDKHWNDAKSRRNE
jgi:MazG family protein